MYWVRFTYITKSNNPLRELINGLDFPEMSWLWSTSPPIVIHKDEKWGLFCFLISHGGLLFCCGECWHVSPYGNMQWCSWCDEILLKTNWIKNHAWKLLNPCFKKSIAPKMTLCQPECHLSGSLRRGFKCNQASLLWRDRSNISKHSV